MKDTETFFREIAESVKQRLCRYIGRAYILPYEWFWLMRDKFPFKPPHEMTILTIFPVVPVDILCLDNSSMIEILKQKYDYLPYISLLMRRKDIENYAWRIVMDSICTVNGG